MRILLVEDQPEAAEMLTRGLREQGYAVDWAADGEEADFKASVNRYDLIVLDVMLPRKSGLDICRDLRASGSNVLILMLTARDATEDRIRGLDLGADDYMVKPFEYAEFVARVRGLLRRRTIRRRELISVGDLQVDFGTHRVERAGKPIQLTAKEFALLEYLARHAEEVVSREAISREVWDGSCDAFSNLIEIYLGRLRKKIDSGHTQSLLHTRRGEGYMLGAAVQNSH
jgi:two-component system copper resistance phosphate regulon response regulator CusR